MCFSTLWSYQSNHENDELEEPPYLGGTVNVPVAHGGHGDHNEVNALPIAQLVNLVESWHISTIL